MYEVQETENAYAGNIPEGAWKTVSRHRTRQAAEKAVVRLHRKMKKRLNPTSSLCQWDSNRRIVEDK